LSSQKKKERGRRRRRRREREREEVGKETKERKTERKG
jgi:hypothetical protein